MHAKLIMALMYSNEEISRNALSELATRFGDIESQSKEYSFGFTNYYEKEFGKNLKKRFIIFREPIRKEDLAEIKKATNEIEDKFRLNAKRQINIDPGYVDKTSDRKSTRLNSS